VPTTDPCVDGENINAAKLKSRFEDRLDALEADPLRTRHGCRLSRAAAQTVSAGVTATVSWDTEREDTDGYIAVTGTTITIPTGLPGIYAITADINPAAGTGNNFLDLVLTSSIPGFPATYRQFIDPNLDRAVLSITVPLAVGDSFIVQVQIAVGTNVAGANLNCYRIGV
jgi:hypothetical protein